jgi:hypothetical protein
MARPGGKNHVVRRAGEYPALPARLDMERLRPNVEQDMRTGLFAAACAAVLTISAGAARADELLESYSAYIGQDDLYNSYDERLTQPWQVIRQDRANVHRFGVRQPGDDVDDFFASARNRELAERMIRNGTIERRAARALLNGDVRIHVEIWRGGDGDYINVSVD